ncbi:hypothetical protein H4582DRAFT_2082646 [Lactarius indigo]|nr:hypothetical protein H4582DRAFT_2082646 [Lactarius indigo]
MYLSAFDIFTNITVSASPTRSRDERPQSPPRTRPPTPSLTSISACSSSDISITPLMSDDEWPGLGSSPQLPKAPATQRVQIYPLVITKPTPMLLTSDASAFEFTIAPFSDTGDEEQDEDVVSWYAGELGQPASLASSPPRFLCHTNESFAESFIASHCRSGLLYLLRSRA